MPLYRNFIKVVEARQWTANKNRPKKARELFNAIAKELVFVDIQPDSEGNISARLGIFYMSLTSKMVLMLDGAEGEQEVTSGSWIVKDTSGFVYVMDNDSFNKIWRKRDEKPVEVLQNHGVHPLRQVIGALKHGRSLSDQHALDIMTNLLQIFEESQATAIVVLQETHQDALQAGLLLNPELSEAEMQDLFSEESVIKHRMSHILGVHALNSVQSITNEANELAAGEEGDEA